MIRMKRNIWTLESLGYLIVVPTNLGWTKDGKNVMGRGVAKQAAIRNKDLAEWYGAECKKHGKDTPVLPYYRLLLFPVKPLNEAEPHLSWQGEADLALIERSTVQLAARPGTERVALPLVGCGNGRKKSGEVLPILQKYLTASRFLLVEFPHTEAKT